MMLRLEMTFIPNVEQHRFFVWLTDSDGKPVKNPSVDTLKVLLSMNRWHDVLHEATIRTVLIEDEEEQVTTEGLFVPMSPLFHLLQKQLYHYHGSSSRSFRFGDTFFYWQQIARGLSTLISSGHYYPTLFGVDKNGQHHFFAHWMLSRRALYTTNTLRMWMANIPSLALSPVDLAPVPVKQWFDVLLDTWTDRIIRSAVAPAYDRVTEDWPNLDWFNDIIPQWFYYLTQKENSFFLVTDDESVTEDVQQAARQIRQWHRPLVHTGQPDPIESIVQFKQQYMTSYIHPVKLMLYTEPLDPENPFAEWSEWQISLQAEGEQGESRSIYDIEELLENHPYSHAWLEEKLGFLSRLDKQFRSLSTQLFRGQFMLECPGKLVFNLYQNHADALQEADIALQFPKWLTWEKWTAKSVDVSLKTSTNHTPTFSLSSIVQFNWKISIGDVSIPFSEFKQIVNDQKRFLKHRGEWVELPLDKMRKALEEMNELGPRMAGKARPKGIMADALRLSITGKVHKSQHVQVELDTATEQYLKKLNQKPNKNLPVPESFRGTLRSYQQHGYAWLSHLREIGVGGCLADDMGLGKTIQAIAYLLNQPASERSNPALVICPTSLLGNWKRELQTFAPELTVYVHHGANRLKEQQFAGKRHNYDVMVTSYPLTTRDKWLQQQEWPILIIDEAQMIKNPATKQSQTVRRLQAYHRLALTGTPMENRLEELWSIMDFLNPGYLGSQQAFRRQFITPIEKHQNKHKSKLLKRLVQPFLLRREKTDKMIIQDLPDKVERKERCPLTKEQAALYQSVVDQLMEKMGVSHGIERKGLILATLTKLKQVCDHPALLSKRQAKQTQSGKLARFFELMDSLLEQNQSALVFTQYVQMGHLLQTFLQQRFSDCPVFFLHGGLSSVKREEMINLFRGYRDQKAVFILSLKAGGLGLNLTEANHVIHYDRWWNPAVEDQATDRSYRIGQQKNVHVYKLLSEGTLEENIDRLIDKKRTLTEQIIGQGDGWMTELTDEELYELIRLREKVVS